MRRNDAGKGYVRAVLTLLVLSAIGYAGVKIVPVYVNNYELQDYIRQQTPFWLSARSSSDTIRNNILSKAQELNLPVSDKQVQVEATGGGVSVAVDYTVPIDLRFYILSLHFTPGYSSHSI